jgi:peroxiredoxin 2/4
MNAAPNLPQIGQKAPEFVATTTKGSINFPTEFGDGNWTIFFAHPANFTGAWVMYSTFLALKEKYFNDRNCKLLGLCTEQLAPDSEGTWAEKVKRYVGIYLKSPVVEDKNRQIAKLYGMVSGRINTNGHDRVAFVIDANGIIRGIISGPFTLQSVVSDLEKTFNRLQGLALPEIAPPDPRFLQEMQEKPDGQPTIPYRSKPAHFPKKELGVN